MIITAQKVQHQSEFRVRPCVSKGVNDEITDDFKTGPGVVVPVEIFLDELDLFGMMHYTRYLGLVDRAERRGLVKRTTSAEDRRVVHVKLTKTGRTLTERVTKEFQDDVAAIVGDLSDRDQTLLSRLASGVVVNQARVLDYFAEVMANSPTRSTVTAPVTTA